MTITEHIKRAIANWEEQDPKEINTGSCAHFADHVWCTFKGANIVSDEDLDGREYTHTFIEYEGRYYDAEAPEGVDDWRDLPIYARQREETGHAPNRQTKQSHGVKMMTLQKLADEAIMCQNACNPLGLSKRYAEVLLELRKALDEAGQSSDTQSLCDHPINRLWASKLHDLAGLGMSDYDRFNEAYKACLVLP